MNDRLENIENQIKNIQETLQILNTNIILLNNHLNKKEVSDSEVLEECKKMGAHIDFIENVYDNVKHPLGYICNKIKYITRNNTIHEITDNSNNSNNSNNNYQIVD